MPTLISLVSLNVDEAEGLWKYLFPILYHLGHLQHSLPPPLQSPFHGSFPFFTFYPLTDSCALDTQPVFLSLSNPFIGSLDGEGQKLLYTMRPCQLHKICLPPQ